jgi:hypothetical protein
MPVTRDDVEREISTGAQVELKTLTDTAAFSYVLNRSFESCAPQQRNRVNQSLKG